MGLKGNGVLKDQTDKRYGNKMVCLFRCAVDRHNSRTRYVYVPATFIFSCSMRLVHYRRRPAEVSS